MSGHKRVINVQSDDTGAHLFDRLCTDLAAGIRSWFGEGDATSLERWPNFEWRGENSSVSCTTWSSARPDGPQMLALELTQHEGSRLWTTRIKVAASAPDEVVIHDERFLTPPSAFQCLPEPVDLLGFLDPYRCTDADEMHAGRVYAVDPNRGNALAQFILAPATQRALPVVLLSAPPSLGGAYIVPPKELATSLRGFAHVFRLNPRVPWPFEAIPIAHRCFNGAARVYWPGYSDSDSASVHRYWRLDAETRANPAATLAAIVAYVYEGSLRLLWDTSPAERVEKARLEEEARRLADDAADELLTEAGEREYRLTQERDFYKARYEEAIQLYAEVKKEIGRLRHQMNMQWVVAEEPAESPAGPQLMLSDEALEEYDNLDEGERRAMETQILAKLLDLQLRESQSDKIDSAGVTAFVFPRKRAASGKRVIYSLDDNVVYVHYLFHHHDAYEQRLAAGITCSQQGEWVPWQPRFEESMA